MHYKLWPFTFCSFVQAWCCHFMKIKTQLFILVCWCVYGTWFTIWIVLPQVNTVWKVCEAALAPSDRILVMECLVIYRSKAISFCRLTMINLQISFLESILFNFKRYLHWNSFALKLCKRKCRLDSWSPDQKPWYMYSECHWLVRGSQSNFMSSHFSKVFFS